jgi:hypothetical protein
MIHDLSGRPGLGASSFEVLIADETTQPLNESILPFAAQAVAELGAPFLSLVRIVAKVFLYLNLPQAARVEERLSSDALDRLARLGPKKAAKLQRQFFDLYDRIILGPKEIAGHGEVSPHLRRGHFRMQPHGPQMSLRKLMFIAPTWVRADRLQAQD